MAKQAELLLTQIHVKEGLEEENVAKLRQKVLQIDVMRPFMTFDAIDLTDGTSRHAFSN